MTTVRILRQAGRIDRIELSGHSGYADAGEDIVCAAATSAVHLAETILNDVLHLGIPFAVNDETASIGFGRPSRFPAGEMLPACDAVLTGFAQYMKQLSAEYPDYIEVLEVQQHA